MKHGSLFTGIGGFDLAAERCGVETAWQVEIDKKAVKVLEKHFPNVRRCGDITKLDPRELECVDLITAGFPCQDLSIAGKRKGLSGERSGLFWEIIRLASVIQPKWLLLENVPGLLSSEGGRDFAVVLAALGECGYGVAWRVLNSQYFGVAQRRRRVFIAGYFGEPCPPEILFERKGRARNIKTGGETGKDVTATIRGGPTNARSHGKQSPILTCALQPIGGGPDDNDAQGGMLIAHGLSAEGADASEDGTGRGTPLIAAPLNARDGKRPLPDRGIGTVTTSDLGVRRLTPLECERLQGFPSKRISVIMEVCVDHQKNVAFVAVRNHKRPKPVGNVEKDALTENAQYAVRCLTINGQVIGKRVRPDVVINCGESEVEIRNQENYILYASYAEKNDLFHQHIKIGDFVQMLAGINIIAERIMLFGGAVLHPKEPLSIHQKNGNELLSWYGEGIMLPVGYVENDLTILKELMKSITYDRLLIGNIGQKLIILSSYVIRAINGYIQKEIRTGNIFIIEIKTDLGWTWGLSDAARYRCLGNAVTVNVVEWIINRIVKYVE